MGGDASCELWRRTVQRHRAQDTAGGVQSRIQGGHCCGENHEVHDHVHAGNADGAEESNEWAFACFVLNIRKQQRQQGQRAYVEDSDVEDNSIDCLRHDLLRVFYLACGGAQKLNGCVCEDHALHENQNWQDAVRENTAVVLNEEIGRASCRERVEVGGVDVEVERKKSKRR